MTSVLCTVNSDAMAQLVGRLSGIRRLPSNGVRLTCGVRLMVNKTIHFNTEFVLKTAPTVVYISFHVYLTETQLPM